MTGKLNAVIIKGTTQPKNQPAKATDVGLKLRMLNMSGTATIQRADRLNGGKLLHRRCSPLCFYSTCRPIALLTPQINVDCLSSMRSGRLLAL